MRTACLLLIVGCADPAAPQARSYNDRDLGGHLQPPDGEDLGPHDLAMVTQDGSVVLDGSSGADLAKVSDLASPPDLSQLADLSQPVINEPPIYVHTASTLYKLDPSTYDLTLIGDFNAGDEITDIAEKDDGSLVAVSRTALFTVNKSTGAASLVGDLGLTDVNALAYLSDGRLLASDIPGNVYDIDFSVSGGFSIITIQTLGSYGSAQSTAGDLVSVDNGTLWGLTKSGGVATDTNNVLMIVNNVTGTGSPKASATGFGKLWGAAYSNHRILGFSSVGEVVEINPSTGVGTLKRTYGGLSFYGATSNPTVLQ
jgi:hypothetical protein